MISASDYSQVWMSPYIAIIRMKTISEIYGREKARSDRRFKREREAWATAVLALALSKMSLEEWWIEIETIDSTPDTRLRQINQSSGHNVIQTRDVEVVDWEVNVDDIMEVIERKCSKAYPGHFLLVVNARNSQRLLDFDRIFEQMKNLRSPFLEIWVVAFIAPGQAKVIRVSPTGPAIDLELRSELQSASKQRAFLRRGHRGTTPGFRELGPVFVPIP